MNEGTEKNWHVTVLQKHAHRKAIKAVSGFPAYLQCSKDTKAATKRCACIVCPCVRPRRSLECCVLFTASTAKLLRPKEELLKQLLTSVSSADHHLVPAPRLPSYRIVVQPHLTEGSKHCSVCPTSLTTLEKNNWTEVLGNNLPAKLMAVIFSN